MKKLYILWVGLLLAAFFTAAQCGGATNNSTISPRICGLAR